MIDGNSVYELDEECIRRRKDQDKERIFQAPGNNLRMCSEDEPQEDAPLQMLNAIREYCTEKEQEMIDNMMTFFLF